MYNGMTFLPEHCVKLASYFRQLYEIGPCKKCYNMGVTRELIIRQFLHSYWSRATAETGATSRDTRDAHSIPV